MVSLLARGFVGSIVGGLVGGFIWTSFSYGTGYELGFVAWVVGALAGYGMARASEGCTSRAAGFLAALVALVAIPCAKLAVVHLHTRELLAEAGEFTEENIVDEFAHEDVMARYDEGDLTDEDLEVYWESGPDTATLAAAQARWDGLPAEEQEARLTEGRAQADSEMENATFALNLLFFLFSFGPYDLLWFGLALTTAYKIGSSSDPSRPAQQSGGAGVHEPDSVGVSSIANSPLPAGGGFFANLGRSEMAATAAEPRPAQGPRTASTPQGDTAGEDNSYFAKLGRQVGKDGEDRRVA